MDASEVKNIVERELPRLQELLAIKEWKITVIYDRLDTLHGVVVQAFCARLYEYNAATITIDPAKMSDAAYVIHALRHELFHVVHSPFDLFYEVAVNLVSDDNEATMLRVYRFATEQFVLNLERMFDYNCLHKASSECRYVKKAKK